MKKLQKNKTTSPVERAFKAAGGTAALAKKVGVSRQTAHNWRVRGRVPVQYIFAVGAAAASPAGYVVNPVEIGALHPPAGRVGLALADWLDLTGLLGDLEDDAATWAAHPVLDFAFRPIGTVPAAALPVMQKLFGWRPKKPVIHPAPRIGRKR